MMIPIKIRMIREMKSTVAMDGEGGENTPTDGITTTGV